MNKLDVMNNLLEVIDNNLKKIRSNFDLIRRGVWQKFIKFRTW